MATRISHIFHPTDLSPASTRAFHHALRLALATRAKITIMHVAASEDEGAEARLPGVRETLVAWGVAPVGGEDEALMDLGIGVRKVVDHGEEPLVACARYLEKHPADLIVLANGQHDGGFSWLADRVSEPLARQAEIPALFVPPYCEGFVGEKDGTLSLKRVLLPVANEPRPGPALQLLAGLADALGLLELQLTVFHAGQQHSLPPLRIPERQGLRHEVICMEADTVNGIVGAAANADLMVMTTKGHDGFMDMLRGDTTERVLRRAPCPLLAVPAGG